MIAVSSLAKSYGGQTLFEDVSLQFNPGERYGVVGANGSGKSTFLRILAGVELQGDVLEQRLSAVGLGEPGNRDHGRGRISTAARYPAATMPTNGTTAR